MKSSANYPYVTDNNLDNIQDYQYSLWHGDSFIVAFQNQRQFALQDLPAADWLVLHNTACNTAFRLWSAVIQLRECKPLVPQELDWILVLLKKFEVSKKLYGCYESLPPHKRCDENYSAPEPYILLAEVVLRQWHVQHNTYWINTALKLIDTLCSVIDGCDEVQRAGIAALITLEQQLLKSLLEAVSEPS